MPASSRWGWRSLGGGSLLAFFVRTLLALAAALALWYWARAWVVAPVGWLAELAMQAFHGGWVQRVEQEDSTLALLTAIRVMDATSGRVGELAPEVNALTYAFGLPLLVALLLGARASGLWWKLPVGALALLPFQAWGVCFSWLVQVTLYASGAMVGGVQFSAWQLNAYGLGYQMGFLIFPTLVPVMVWLAMEREFVTKVVIGGRARGG